MIVTREHLIKQRAIKQRVGSGAAAVQGGQAVSGQQQAEAQPAKGRRLARDGKDTRPLIAHLIYRLDHGGLEQLLVELLRRMPDSAFRHTVICVADYAEAFRQRLPQEVEVYALNKPPGLGVGTLARSFLLLRRLRPDVTHSCNLAALEHQTVAALSGVPARIHVEHGWDVADLFGTNRKYRWLRRWLSPWVNRHVTVSRHLASYLTERVGIPAARVQQIYNGVDVERFCACLGQSPTATPVARSTAEGFVIGTIGRLSAVKDQASLLHAFAQLRDSLPAERFAQLRLVIIGSGPLADELQQLAEALGIGAQLWLAGAREDIEAQLRRIDLFVLPSLAEGIPVTVLEAMACSRPVVAAAVGGVPELVVDGVTGTLVPAADSQALANALTEYIDAPQLCRRHGEAGRERVVEHFSLERMVDDYRNLYDELLNGRTNNRLQLRSTASEQDCQATEARPGPRSSEGEG